jgi:hypothetical protein
VAGNVDDEDRIERLPAKREVPGIGNGQMDRRRIRPLPGKGDGAGGYVDRGDSG